MTKPISLIMSIHLLFAQIINPWGKILAEAEPSEQLIYGEIDLNFLEQTRKEMPVLEHKYVIFKPTNEFAIIIE